MRRNDVGERESAPDDGPQPVSVVDGQQATLASLEAGDWTCCVRTVRKYGLMAPSGTSSWMVADVPTAPDAYAWQYAGTATHGGVLQFGTEIVSSADNSLAALLGASPGASTAVWIRAARSCSSRS